MYLSIVERENIEANYEKVKITNRAISLLKLLVNEDINKAVKPAPAVVKPA